MPKQVDIHGRPSFSCVQTKGKVKEEEEEEEGKREHGSVFECLPSMCKTFGSVLNSIKEGRERRRDGGREGGKKNGLIFKFFLFWWQKQETWHRQYLEMIFSTACP